MSWIKDITGTTQSTEKFNMQMYDTAGVYTFTAPITGKYKVTVVGAGGGGGGAKSTSASYIAYAGGGCGGGATIKHIYLNKKESITATVGAGGSGGDGSTPTDGEDGGTSSFGTHVSATGGIGAGLAVATSGNATSAPGLPGIGYGGDLNIRGGAGLTGQISHGHSGLGGSSFLSGMINGRSVLNVSGFDGLYGGGGSGGAANNGTSTGGKGGDGVVLIEW